MEAAGEAIPSISRRGWILQDVIREARIRTRDRRYFNLIILSDAVTFALRYGLIVAAPKEPRLWNTQASSKEKGALIPIMRDWFKDAGPEPM
jgi:uncharacterized membrane protein